MTELNPCPFCGASGDDLELVRIDEVLLLDEARTTNQEVIRCSACGATGPTGNFPDEFGDCRHWWNRGTWAMSDEEAERALREWLVWGFDTHMELGAVPEADRPFYADLAAEALRQHLPAALEAACVEWRSNREPPGAYLGDGEFADNH